MTKKHTNILVIDVGGTHVKLFCTGQPEAVKIPSGPDMTAAKMVALVKKAVAKWTFTAISIGYPGQVVHQAPVAEPHNLATGWVGFDFEKAFGCPVRVINDAAMQALGSYEGGRMLFLGFGTGLGSAMIVDGILEPMELAHLPYKHGRTYEEYVGERGLERLGKKKWRKAVTDVVVQLKAAMGADYVVLGGGNCRLIEKLPENVRLGDNVNAFQGGLRLWQGATARISAAIQKPVLESDEPKADKHDKKHKDKKAKKAHHSGKVAKANKRKDGRESKATDEEEAVETAAPEVESKSGKKDKPAKNAQPAKNGKPAKKSNAVLDDDSFDDDDAVTGDEAAQTNGAGKTASASKPVKSGKGSPVAKGETAARVAAR